MSSRKRVIAIMSLLAFAGEVAAEAPIDSEPARLFVTGGWGSDVAIYGVGATWAIPWKQETLARHGLDVRIGADLLRWDGRENGSLWDVGVTPYLRWRPDAAAWHSTFIQLGIGLHVLSHTGINGTRHFGTPFQFGERLAWGCNFGSAPRYEMTLFVQHVSNGRIKEPNGGLTSYGATLGIPID